MSNENLESRITAKKITYKKPYMGTKGIVRFHLSLPENPTPEDYSKMLKMYRDIKDVFASAPLFTRHLPKEAYREFTKENRPELKEYDWATPEGLNILVEKSLANEDKKNDKNVYMTFTASSIYPAGTLPQSTAFILAQVRGPHIYDDENDKIKENGDVNPHRKTSLSIKMGEKSPEITAVVLTVMVDTSKDEIKEKIEKAIEKYTPLEEEVQETLYNFS